jgi:hypothetical protein
MQFGETFGIALDALRANKLRSFLTMLGVVIGVAAVIAMVALGRGAQQSVNERIAALGTTLLTVTPGQIFGRGVASGTDRARLTMDDAQALEQRGRYIAAVEPEMSGQAQVQYGSANANTSVVGTTGNYPEVRRYTIAAGRMFSDAENQGTQRVAVLGSAVLQNLGASAPEALVGESVRIKGIQFTVVGVLAAKGQGTAFGDPDDQVLIPVNTARFRVLGTDRIRSINVLAPSEGAIPQTMADIQSILRREHRLRARPGRRLQHPQPGGLPEHARRDDADVHVPARGHRGREPARRRDRDHEHHARLRHRAHARDRRPQGAGRHAAHDPAAVPDRGGGALPFRRHDRGAARRAHGVHADAGGGLERVGVAAVRGPGVRVSRRSWG